MSNKKIIVITFNSQPVVGVGVNYTIQINGFSVVYPSGANTVSFEYKATAFGDPLKVQIRSTLSQTIDATLAYLVQYYSSPAIIYQRNGDTIEVLVNSDLSSVAFVGVTNPSLTVITENTISTSSIGLKYYFEYKNVMGDDYKCEIYQKNYTGASQLISGRGILEKASVNNHLDPIRGGGLTLKLEANKDLTLEDLYSENEQDFIVKFFQNTKLAFYGYLNPDGVYQDYVRDEWIISLDCVDGLGAIANLSFVQESGFHFTGKMLMMDIIYYCLKRTGLSMPINTSVNIYYDGMTGDDVFRKASLNTDRFVKTDGETIMSCEEVLKSILDIFKACITQWDGEWYIYKPNEIFVQSIVTFKRFDVLNNYLGNKSINLNKSLGSNIDNFYPHHCTGNQRIEIKGSIGGFRLGYKYGLVSGLMENPSLVKIGNTLSYEGWTVNSNYWLLNDPLKNSGFYFRNDQGTGGGSSTIISDPLAVTVDDLISFKIDYNVESPFGSAYAKMQIKVGSYYLNYAPKNNQTPIEDTQNAVWSLTPGFFIFYLVGKVGSITINMPKIPIDGNITFDIYKFAATGPDGATINSTTYISYFEVTPTQTENRLEGEFHTVERGNKVSSIVKENQTVYNGDNASTIYLGAIFDENLEPTTAWNRVNSFEKFPLLRIAAEEELRIAQRPTKIFRGDFFGYIPYLSLITINNVGKFMPIEWSYDTYTNVTQCKQLELFVAELSDIKYTPTFDYGETVKPTIK